MSSADHGQLVELLVSKDKELKATLQLAAEQDGIEKKMDGLREQVKEQDEEINQLQMQLKEAEHILATSIFQGRQKLSSINKSVKPSGSLIGRADKGDLRRPYPTETEMRLIFLGKSYLNINGHNMPQNQNSLTEMQRNAAGAESGVADLPASAQNQFAWHPSGELHMTMGAGARSVPLDTRAHKDASQDDVEVMSTDSSSSSDLQ